MSFWIIVQLWEILGCEIFEDLSAICGGTIAWSVPW